jgi:hypothetical protein
VLIQRQVGYHLLETAVFILEHLQAAHLRGPQAAVELLPAEEALFANTHLPDDFLNRGTRFSLAESKGDLLVRVA